MQVVSRQLEAHYGAAPWREHGSPLDELIATVLSQHTSDTNTARAFRALKHSFAGWEAVSAAPVADVEAAIRPGGLAATKAPRIQGILRGIKEKQGRLNLSHLRQMPLEDARAWLLALHGVGPKTAACVLLFSLGLPALPVDTHVFRVSKRLGLILDSVTAESAHGLLEEAMGDDRDVIYAFHMHMIRHGRTVCKAQRPRCGECVLSDRCTFFNQSECDD